MPLSVRFSPFMFFIPLFLTACTASPHTSVEKSAKAETTQPVDDLLGDLKAGSSDNVASYAPKIKHAVEEKMYKPESYKEQKCTIRLLLGRDGLVMGATAESGDSELCNAVMMAVKQANIPPAPDEKTWQEFRNTSLDFSY